MKDLLDRLSKELAGGTSRRNALKHFFRGIGAVVGALILRKPAKADGNSVCRDLCRAQGLDASDFGACMSASAHCPSGQCSFLVHNMGLVCMPVV